MRFDDAIYVLGGAAILFAAANSVEAGTRSITFLGKTVDQTDFQSLGFGQAGFYFPQFDAPSPTTQRPTDENMEFSPPSWTSFQFDIVQPDRTFSPDAGLLNTDPLVVGVYSEGGDSAWDRFTLPDGTVGLSGSVVDEATENNSNNTVNRIQLGAGTPSSFLLRIVVDNTNNTHDPLGRLQARGASDLDGSIDIRTNAQDLTFDGTTDVYTFRYDHFVADDFIKIQLNSGVEGTFAGFGGLMFDVIPEPSSAALGLVGLVSGLCYLRRRTR